MDRVVAALARLAQELRVFLVVEEVVSPAAARLAVVVDHLDFPPAGVAQRCGEPVGAGVWAGEQVEEAELAVVRGGGGRERAGGRLLGAERGALRLRCGMRGGGERVVPSAVRSPIEVLLIDHHARRGDDRAADEDVVRALRVSRPAEEGADPPASVDARLVLVRRRFQHNSSAAEATEVHHARRAKGEALVERDQRVCGGRAGRADGRVVPVDHVRDDPRPVAGRRAGRARTAEAVSEISPMIRSAIGFKS